MVPLSKRRRPLALAYHGVSGQPLSNDPHRLFVSQEDLIRHIDWLRGNGYRLVTFSEWASRVAADDAEGHATLTFDDGFADNETMLLPVLSDLKVPATVFVIPGLLGEPHPDAALARIATADAVRGLARAGVEIGSHSMCHDDLTQLSLPEAEADLRDSRQKLRDLVQQPIDTVAYPFGHATEETRTAARAAGYAAACRTAGFGRLDDPFDLPREAMGNRSSVTGLRLKARGWYEPAMSTVPGRVLRRARLNVHERLHAGER